MATIEQLDLLRNGLTDRGLGPSGATSQAIQRAELPSLSKAVAESEATRRNLERNRKATAISKVFRNRAGLRSGRGSGRGSGNNGNPLAVLSVDPRQKGRPLTIESASGAGARSRTRKFNSIPELASFLRENPAVASRLAVSGVDPTDSLSTQELQKLNSITNLNLGRISRGDARQVIGKSRNPAGMSRALKAMSQLHTGTPKKPKKKDSLGSLAEALSGIFAQKGVSVG